MAPTTRKVDMFTEIYMNHANGTIKDLVAKNKCHRISRRKIEFQILEGIDRSKFPTAFRIVFYSMVLHTNTFDVYWFGQRNLLGLSKLSITQLKPDMSLLQNLHGTGALDILTSLSSDESGVSCAEESDEDSIQGDSLDTTEVPTPTTNPAYSLINGEYVRIGPSDVEFPDRDEHPHSRRSYSKSPHPEYPTPNETPVQQKKSIAPTTHHEEESEEDKYTTRVADWMTEDPLDDDYIDPSFIDCPVITAFGIPLDNPTKINTPASSPVPGPGGLKSKTSAKSKRGGGPKKQAPTRPPLTPKTKTGGKKATGAGTGAGIRKAKAKGKGKGKGN